MSSHNNLFADLPDANAVYRAMQDHMKRDRYLTVIFGSAALFSFFQALQSGMAEGWPWLIGGVAAAFCSLIYFIDNSNRNFYLHTVDWIEAARVSSVDNTD